MSPRRWSSIIDEGKADLKLLYSDDMPLFEKIRTIAKEIYRADDATADKSVKDQLKTWEEMGFGKLPVCIAKTAVFVLDQPGRQGRADRLLDPGARGAALRRRRVRRGDLRRDHDHAGPAEGAVGRLIDVGADGRIIGLF